MAWNSIFLMLCFKEKTFLILMKSNLLLYFVLFALYPRKLCLYQLCKDCSFCFHLFIIRNWQHFMPSHLCSKFNCLFNSIFSCHEINFLPLPFFSLSHLLHFLSLPQYFTDLNIVCVDLNIGTTNVWKYWMKYEIFSMYSRVHRHRYNTDMKFPSARNKELKTSVV